MPEEPITFEDARQIFKDSGCDEIIFEMFKERISEIISWQEDFNISPSETKKQIVSLAEQSSKDW